MSLTAEIDRLRELLQIPLNASKGTFFQNSEQNCCIFVARKTPLNTYDEAHYEATIYLFTAYIQNSDFFLCPTPTELRFIHHRGPRNRRSLTHGYSFISSSPDKCLGLPPDSVTKKTEKIRPNRASPEY